MPYNVANDSYFSRSEFVVYRRASSSNEIEGGMIDSNGSLNSLNGDRTRCCIDQCHMSHYSHILTVSKYFAGCGILESRMRLAFDVISPPATSITGKKKILDRKYDFENKRVEDRGCPSHLSRSEGAIRRYQETCAVQPPNPRQKDCSFLMGRMPAYKPRRPRHRFKCNERQRLTIVDEHLWKWM